MEKSCLHADDQRIPAVSFDLKGNVVDACSKRLAFSAGSFWVRSRSLPEALATLVCSPIRTNSAQVKNAERGQLRGRGSARGRDCDTSVPGSLRIALYFEARCRDTDHLAAMVWAPMRTQPSSIKERSEERRVGK